MRSYFKLSWAASAHSLFDWSYKAFVRTKCSLSQNCNKAETVNQFTLSVCLIRIAKAHFPALALSAASTRSADTRYNHLLITFCLSGGGQAGRFYQRCTSLLCQKAPDSGLWWRHYMSDNRADRISMFGWAVIIASSLESDPSVWDLKAPGPADFHRMIGQFFRSHDYICCWSTVAISCHEVSMPIGITLIIAIIHSGS